MKHRSLIFFLFLSLSSTVFGQPHISYAQTILKAENAIIENDLKKAKELYHHAFEIRKPFSRDLHNALVVNQNLGDWKTCQKLCDELILMGAGLEYFNKRIFGPLKQNKIFKSTENTYPQTRIRYQKSIDTSIIRELKNLVELDQSFYRRKATNNNNQLFMDSLQATDTYIASRLKFYFAKFGYLGEDIIGGNFQDTTLRTVPIFHVLLLHNSQSQAEKLKIFWDSALTNGLIEPGVYASIASFSRDRFGQGPAGYIVQYQGKLYASNNTNRFNKIEEERITVGLSSFEDLKKKFFYAKYTDPSYIFFTPVSTIGSFRDEQSEKGFLAERTEINVP